MHQHCKSLHLFALCTNTALPAAAVDQYCTVSALLSEQERNIAKYLKPRSIQGLCFSEFLVHVTELGVLVDSPAVQIG
jgi:hypothetical protein